MRYASLFIAIGILSAILTVHLAMPAGNSLFI